MTSGIKIGHYLKDFVARSARHVTNPVVIQPFCLFDCWRFVPIRWVGPGNKLFQWSFNVSVCLIAEDLSQSAGYKQLQWSFNLSVCLIASDLSRYAGYELFQWSYSPGGGDSHI